MAIVEPELLTDDIIETYQSNITAIKHQLGTLADIVWNEEEAKCPNCWPYCIFWWTYMPILLR